MFNLTKILFNRTIQTVPQEKCEEEVQPLSVGPSAEEFGARYKKIFDVVMMFFGDSTSGGHLAHELYLRERETYDSSHSYIDIIEPRVVSSSKTFKTTIPGNDVELILMYRPKGQKFYTVTFIPKIPYNPDGLYAFDFSTINADKLMVIESSEHMWRVHRYFLTKVKSEQT